MVKAKQKNNSNLIGAWVFLIGVIVSVIFGLFGAITEVVVWILILVGLIIGFLNIASEETTPFLTAGAVLIFASAFGQGAVSVIPVFERILRALLLIFVPAVIIVAIKSLFLLAKR
ncbi:MAG: hypothetical protein Q8Q04_03080 [archaeon]|nr:hypothetical protein [archaeon]